MHCNVSIFEHVMKAWPSRALLLNAPDPRPSSKVLPFAQAQNTRCEHSRAKMAAVVENVVKL